MENENALLVAVRATLEELAEIAGKYDEALGEEIRSLPVETIEGNGLALLRLHGDGLCVCVGKGFPLDEGEVPYELLPEFYLIVGKLLLNRLEPRYVSPVIGEEELAGHEEAFANLLFYSLFAAVWQLFLRVPAMFDQCVSIRTEEETDELKSMFAHGASLYIKSKYHPRGLEAYGLDEGMADLYEDYYRFAVELPPSDDFLETLKMRHKHV